MLKDYCERSDNPLMWQERCATGKIVGVKLTPKKVEPMWGLS